MEQECLWKCLWENELTHKGHTRFRGRLIRIMERGNLEGINREKNQIRGNKHKNENINKRIVEDQMAERRR